MSDNAKLFIGAAVVGLAVFYLISKSNPPISPKIGVDTQSTVGLLARVKNSLTSPQLFQPVT